MKDTQEVGITCSNCETENLAGAKFCNKCGRPLAENSRTVNIVCGANSQSITLGETERLTVGEIRSRLGDVLNIPDTALALVGEETVDDSRELVPGETLQFIKQSGSKG